MNIYVCVGSSCHLKGSYQIIELMKKALEDNGLTDQVNLSAAFCLGKCRKKSQQQFPFLGQRMDFLKFKIYINSQFLQLPGGFQYSICVACKTSNGFRNNLPKTAFPGIFQHFAKSGADLFVAGNSKIIIYFCQNVIWGFLHKFLIMANLIFQGILLMGVKGGNAAVYCGGNG